MKLKTLPSHLAYSYIGSNDTFSIILSSSLGTIEKEKLLRVLGEHKGAIPWSIVNIKSISPSIYLHYILIEDGYKTSTEPQKRLNPNMKEVIKKEELKHLDLGIIYPILDSMCVSPVQVVPKRVNHHSGKCQ